MDAKTRKIPGPCRFCGHSDWEDMSPFIVDDATTKAKWWCRYCCSGFVECVVTYAPAAGTYQEGNPG